MKRIFFLSTLVFIIFPGKLWSFELISHVDYRETHDYQTYLYFMNKNDATLLYRYGNFARGFACVAEIYDIETNERSFLFKSKKGCAEELEDGYALYNGHFFQDFIDLHQCVFTEILVEK